MAARYPGKTELHPKIHSSHHKYSSFFKKKKKILEFLFVIIAGKILTILQNIILLNKYLASAPMNN